MALNDVQHVKAVALIRALLEDPTAPTIRATAEGWLEENHPPPSAYIAAMSSLVEPEP